MPDWIEGKLGDSIARLDAGVSVNAEDRPHGAGEIGVLKTSAVSGGLFLPHQNKTVVEQERRLVAEPVQGNSILVSRMNTPALVGESCYVEEAQPSLFLPDRLWQLKPRDRAKTHMRWLSFVLQSAAYRRHVEVHATGTSGTMKNLPKSKLLTFPVRFPEPLEQQSIARVLDTLDVAIRETEAIVAKLKAVKQGLLHDLLTRGIDTNGELRPPQAQAPCLYKESPLGPVPNAWEIRPGADVCEEIVVGIVIRPTQYYKTAGIPVFRSANVRENRLSMTDLVYMSERDHRLLGKSAVRPGDVLTVRTGYPGTSCVVDSSVREANCVDILISRPSRDLDPRFWARWINSHRGKAQVLAAQGGLAQQHFNVADLQCLMVSMPALDEQSEIATRLDAADDCLGAESECLVGMTALKSGLMDDLLTGRVRVTPPLQPAATMPT